MAVYMIRAGENGPVKIGHSTRADVRIADFQNGHYEELHILRIMEGGRGIERWLHGRYADHRVRGEWFHFQPEMLTIIPGDNADIARLGERFTECQESLISTLKTRQDLTYDEIARRFSLRLTTLLSWVHALQRDGIVPKRRTIIHRYR